MVELVLEIKGQRQLLLAANFRAALAESKVSPGTIAAACDVSEQAVSGWKRHGKIAKQHLPIIAGLTGWSVHRLLTGDANPETFPKPLGDRETALLEGFRELLDHQQDEILELLKRRVEESRSIMDNVRKKLRLQPPPPPSPQLVELIQVSHGLGNRPHPDHQPHPLSPSHHHPQEPSEERRREDSERRQRQREGKERKVRKERRDGERRGGQRQQEGQEFSP